MGVSDTSHIRKVCLALVFVLLADVPEPLVQRVCSRCSVNICGARVNQSSHCVTGTVLSASTVNPQNLQTPLQADSINPHSTQEETKKTRLNKFYCLPEAV